MYVNLFKPLLDRLGALILLILLSPLIFLTALIIAWRIGSPIYFTQKRPGIHGEIFTIYKFRTMTNEKDAKGNLLPDSERLQGIGELIRTLSLDELPQLLNILKGEMSFIGPRPLLVEYLPLYTQEQFKRHNVKPGITGWAQINGRNAISWEEKFRYDVEYVNNISFAFDLKIFFLTLKKVVMREGISQQGEATMEKFRGNK
ncbi:sugar transferase [Sulfuricurvum sp.]|uniref:sugar transferase n=1 Tax=Sulfuricurvum sp. TaxID=2025608 RepID=UPI00199CDA59|nr:sugar transferase [Sulfuricurvum sp.]MBD3799468.1 sugar transferase [Campylobacterota bacterium]MBD3805675.1 sugar transferase [Sulfuricurvum sp.]